MLDALTTRLPHFGSAKRDRARSPAMFQFVRRRSHAVRSIIVWAIALLVALAVLGFFVVPPVAKHYLVKGLSEQLERPVTIEEIHFNPFTLTAQVKGLSVQEKRSSQVFVSFDELLLNLEYRSLIRRAPVLKQVLLLRP